jgi:hypothetical protein
LKKVLLSDFDQTKSLICLGAENGFMLPL